jgi:lysyl-tRNA synthetase class II
VVTSHPVTLRITGTHTLRDHTLSRKKFLEAPTPTTQEGDIDDDGAQVRPHATAVSMCL